MKKTARAREQAPAHGLLEVTGLSHDGRGVARGAGKTVFVEGALPGELVRCRVLRSRPRFDEARLVEPLRPAPERTAPPCVHYGHCGGCSLQHLAPPAQLAAHARQLADALERIARLRPRAWLPALASEPWGYRARARLAVVRDRASRRVTLGFRRSGSRAAEPITACLVLLPELSALIAPLAALLGALQDPARVRELFLAAGEPGVALGVACAAPLGEADRAALADFCAVNGVTLHIGAPDAGGTLRWPAGGTPLHYRAGADGPVLEFMPWHFTQANRAVNRALIAAVIARLEPRAEDHVLDLFCGLGNFSLPLARDAAALCARGAYTLSHAGVFEMFPQTPHLESLAVFEAAV